MLTYTQKQNDRIIVICIHRHHTGKWFHNNYYYSKERSTGSYPCHVESSPLWPDIYDGLFRDFVSNSRLSSLKQYGCSCCSYIVRYMETVQAAVSMLCFEVFISNA